MSMMPDGIIREVNTEHKLSVYWYMVDSKFLVSGLINDACACAKALA